MLIRGVSYNISIEMPTIEDEAYEAINDLVKIGNKFLIQNASKVIGGGTIKETTILRHFQHPRLVLQELNSNRDSSLS